MEHDLGTAELADGEMREVEAGEDKILLARVGGRCHAVGATCPHAGGPLAKGVLHGDTVLCPWHKAAFRLTDGKVVAPPAVDDLPAYALREDGGRLKATRRDAVRLERGADTGTVAIIGSGAAGVEAARTLRQHGFGGRVVLIGQESQLPYDRTVLSKYSLSGKKGGEKDPLHGAEFYRDNAIERLVATVTAVDPAHKRISFADAPELDYTQALFATGGKPKHLHVPGADLPQVFVLRTQADVSAILRSAGGAGHAVVAGTGFIGMEAAASLSERGLHVTVVSPESVPFEKKLGAEVGGVFRRVHEAAGIAFRLDDEITGIEGEGRVRSVRLRSGASLPADLVITGLGVTPATGVLRGVDLREDGGVLTDSRLRVADGLYAAGDVAAFPLRGDGAPVRVEHWRVAEQHGRVAALNMTGRDTMYAAVPYFWTIHFKKRLDYVGHAEDWDSVEVGGDLAKPEFTALYVKDGVVQAVAGWGMDTAMARAIGLMEDRRDWPAAELRRAMAG